MNGFGIQTKNINDLIKKIEQELAYIKSNYDKNVVILTNKLEYCSNNLENLKIQVNELQTYSETEYNKAQTTIDSLNSQIEDIRTRLNTIQYNEITAGKCASGINYYPIYAKYAEKDVNGVDITAYNVSSTLIDKINEEQQRALNAESNLNDSIVSSYNELNDTISSNYNELNETINSNYNSLSSTISETTENLETIITEISSNLNRLIDNSVSALTQTISSNYDALEGDINSNYNTLTALIDNETQRATNREDILTNDIVSETTRSILAETSLEENLNAEVTRATQRDNTLEQKIENEKTRATNKENELSAYFSQQIASISTEEGHLGELLNDEIARATSSENVLSGAIDNEIVRSTNRENEIETELSGLIVAESGRAFATENIISAALDAEIGYRTEAITNLQSLLTDEISARKHNDTVLQNILNTEISDRELADSNLQTSIYNETLARQTSDTNLQSQIDAIEATQNVIDLVSNYATLVNYDTTNIKVHDKIQVINDETSGYQTTIYSWENSAWSGIGLFGPYYTQAQIDNLYNELANTKQDNLSAGDGIAITENVISHSVKIIENDNYDTVEGTKLTIYLKNNKYKKITFNKLITDIEFVIEKSENNILQETGFEFTCPEDSELENVTFSVLNDNTIKILTIIPDSYTSPNVYQGTIVNYKCTIGEFEVED